MNTTKTQQEALDAKDRELEARTGTPVYKKSGEGNAPRVAEGQFVSIKGKQYQVSRGTGNPFIHEGTDFMAQPVNKKTGKGWQAERSFNYSDIDPCDDKYCEVHNPRPCTTYITDPNVDPHCLLGCEDCGHPYVGHPKPEKSEGNALREQLQAVEAQRDELQAVVRSVRSKLYSEKELFDMACEVLDNQDAKQAAIAKAEQH